MNNDVLPIFEEHSAKIDVVLSDNRWPYGPSIRFLKGLITHRDILRASISTIAELTSGERRAAQAQVLLQDIMQTSVLTIRPEANIKEAARVMLEHKIGCLLVVQHRQLVGILTEADFLKFVLDEHGMPDNDESEDEERQGGGD